MMKLQQSSKVVKNKIIILTSTIHNYKIRINIDNIVSYKDYSVKYKESNLSFDIHVNENHNEIKKLIEYEN